ncbi:MAG: SDR family oxidoreductase [Alicyclobacillus sp.]|nr:SDR family oxidoreductase [Alicyclobacillus sp.]
MDLGLTGKVALVAASSGGLGFATAQQFAREGATVVLTSRSADRLEDARRRVVEETGNASVYAFAADVSKGADIDRLFASIEAHVGGVDVLVTNAGGPPPGSFATVTEPQWEAAFQLSLMSVVRLIRGVLPNMQAKRWGRIVNFTSSSIKQPIDNLILSNTFRTAVAGLAKSLALELAPDGILVNTMGPGRIATDRVASLDAGNAERAGVPLDEWIARSQASIPLGRYGRPEEFASLAVYLGSPANGYITGQSILVDGGMVRAL